MIATIFATIASLLFKAQWMLGMGTDTAKVLQQDNVGELKRCLKSWTVFAVVTYLEGPMDILIGSWFPFYTITKYSLLYTLMTPNNIGNNTVSTLLYDYCIHPILQDLGDRVDAQFWTNVPGQVALGAGTLMDNLPAGVQRGIRKADGWITGALFKIADTWTRLEFRNRDNPADINARGNRDHPADANNARGSGNQASGSNMTVQHSNSRANQNNNVKVEIVEVSSDEDEEMQDIIPPTPNVNTAGPNTARRRRVSTSSNQNQNNRADRPNTRSTPKKR